MPVTWANTFARRRTKARRALFAATLAIPLVFTAVPSAAWADVPGNKYFWSCGATHTGGVFIEDWGKTITVLVDDETGQHRYIFHNHVAKNIEAGHKGTAQDLVSNDGSFGKHNHAFCN